MTISLATIREILRETFGRDSFIASFIKSVEPTKSCPTSCINAEGDMKYNEAFVAQHIKTRSDLFCLIVHELIHPMFGHFVHDDGNLENIAADMVINAMVSSVFAGPSGNGNLFRRYYDGRGLEGLLRPGSKMRHSRYGQLYYGFYTADDFCPSERKLSTGEVIHTLKILTTEEEADGVNLLGTHDGQGGSPRPFPASTLSDIADDFNRAATAIGGARAGSGDKLFDFFLDVLKQHRSIKKTLLEKYTTKRKLDHFKQSINQPRIGVSPIPINPSKRDFVLLAAGITPFHYHNRTSRESTEERGLAVYLDVSGSVNQFLPMIIGMLEYLKSDLVSIFLFSNNVVEVPFKTLLAGRIQTTYGTDFDCVAESIITLRLDKAVVITDGYANMKAENQMKLIKCGFQALTVLFGDKKGCLELAPFGDVVLLEEVCD